MSSSGTMVDFDYNRCTESSSSRTHLIDHTLCAVQSRMKALLMACMVSWIVLATLTSYQNMFQELQRCQRTIYIGIGGSSHLFGEIEQRRARRNAGIHLDLFGETEKRSRGRAISNALTMEHTGSENFRYRKYLGHTALQAKSHIVDSLTGTKGSQVILPRRHTFRNVKAIPSRLESPNTDGGAVHRYFPSHVLHRFAETHASARDHPRQIFLTLSTSHSAK